MQTCATKLFAFCLAQVLCGIAFAQSLAPGFSALPQNATVALMPSDIELFEITAGGVAEPKAEWTEAANRHFRAALLKKQQSLGVRFVELSADKADELTELSALHGAVARAINLHHYGPLHLPTKGDALDWSLGEAAQLAQKATGADYALFTTIRDGYTSAGRAAVIGLFTILALGNAGAAAGGPRGGGQSGYASLVDLRTGRVIWFNRLQRGSGDLREADKAEETEEALLKRFPAPK